MIISWSQFRAQILYSLLVFGLFAIALNMSPLMRKTIVISEPLVADEPLQIIIDLPDFGSIVDVQRKKQAFFNFLQPFIDKENREILRERAILLNIQAHISPNTSLSEQNAAFLVSISEKYKIESLNVESTHHVQRLLKRIDVIPSSLVLAQAANESAWGTSRFARQGNNFFGQWCYTKGCGIVPSRRKADANHEVKKFDNVGDSVHAYFMNLNTFPSYESLRGIRQQLRDNNSAVDGISLTEGLHSYSERGEEYIWELQSMIYSNELMLLDEA